MFSTFHLDASAVRLAIACCALVSTLLVWTKARGGNPRWKWASVLGPAVLLVPVLIGLGVWSLAKQNRGDLRWAWSILFHKNDYENTWDYDSPNDVWMVSPDGRMVAYRDKAVRGYRWFTGENRRIRYPVYDDCIRVRWRDHRSRVVRSRYNAPLAWLPDGALLLISSVSSERVALVEWNSASGRSRTLRTFSRSAGRPSMPPVLRAASDASGQRVALLAVPYRGTGVDLWMLDRSKGRMRLIRPGLAGVNDLAWSGDLLILQGRYGRYWSIEADGTGMRRIDPSDGRG
jgi:hypothetical protein